ncbi:hypothetical protein [Terribacillus saccharophilus]|uniref:Uncharacterized protein n=1 Tax=Terribacillus saccharophilus TaxID=361277 RepID=A0ABX4H0S6_9BACI|nr:hypothetical protein [Terribacillus saccharophilus]PAD36349.1 hypothetical protein CHH56_04985 [Terribacillus saccharophilus]PAD95009.1 hypothetical protein CHH50_15500 [Terribacillus saccharophilus]PAE00724.1 hypothetical protein CHH48_05695 [Terribacillus saccharophilus]
MNPYNSMIRVGRLLRHKKITPENNAAELQQYFAALESHMAGRSTEEFFKLFPPIKNYVEDGTWDYSSSLKFKKELGPFFTKESFIELLMTRCYENPFISKLGLAFMMSASALYRQQTGQSIIKTYLSGSSVPKRVEKAVPKKRHLYLVK